MIPIFTPEIIDGLETKLSLTASISYACLVEPSESAPSINKNMRTVAGISDKDLYYTQSILVTTSWNKNDDIFDSSEVWKSKNTPIHKPTNLEHNEAAIVGHITANWPITEDGILIDPATPLENLPNKYHILTGSVIYTGYTEPELKQRAMTLIQEIEQGNKYVSMECFFEGFDYGLINKSTGEFKVLGRSEDTAFLTKYLRAYGGTGEHQEHKIGRVLRNITFSGKGFVDKPANPDSIIFTKHNLNNNFYQKEKNDAFINQGVFSIQANLKETDMSVEEVNTLESNTEATSNDTLENSQVNTVEVSELESSLKNAEAELISIKSSIEEKDLSIQGLSVELETIKSELAAAKETIAAYKQKEEEMMKKEKNMKRQAALIESGMTSELASSTVEKFAELDDQAFEDMREVFAAVMPPKKKEEMKDDMVEETKVEKTTKSSTESVAEILDQAEPEDSLDLSVGNEIAVSEIENTRAALVDFVYNRLGKKLNKGE